MALKSTVGAVCSRVKHVTRQTLLLGLGVTAVLVENVRENAGPYSEKLMERGEHAAQTINEAYDQRRNEIRERARANGHVKEEVK
ncbi:MAG: hypothetical protein H6659_04520 [Ardenticatenaceae bacterium]|nr:hypothetical protein [Ardenticatenaceae bacterium]MCB8987673.1 hypothetical protein [Ardenticatenaceae bacterium]